MNYQVNILRIRLIKNKNIFDIKKYFNLIFNDLTFNFKFAPLIDQMKHLLLPQKQVILFIIAGGLSAVVEIGSFKIFSVYLPQFFSFEKNFYGIHFPLSNVFSTSLGIISNYFFSIWFVFERGKHSKRREFAYFMLVSMISTFLSLLFFQIFFRYVFRDNLDLGFFVFSPEMLSKIFAIIVVSILNYSVKKRLIFNG